MIASDEDVEKEFAEAEAEATRNRKTTETTSELVDDDYLLLEEAHGVRFRRRKKAEGLDSSASAAPEQVAFLLLYFLNDFI